jgi:hypothetical protein
MSFRHSSISPPSPSSVVILSEAKNPCICRCCCLFLEGPHSTTPMPMPGTVALHGTLGWAGGCQRSFGWVSRCLGVMWRREMRRLSGRRYSGSINSALSWGLGFGIEHAEELPARAPRDAIGHRRLHQRKQRAHISANASSMPRVASIIPLFMDLAQQCDEFTVQPSARQPCWPAASKSSASST